MTMITIWWLQKSAKDCNKQANHSQKAKQYEVKEQYQIRISGKVCSLIKHIMWPIIIGLHIPRQHYLY